MIEIEFPFWGIYQVFDEHCALAEILAFPELSRLGGKRDSLRRQLRRNVQKLAAEIPLGELHRRQLGGEPSVGSVTVELEPAQGIALWRRPLPLIFPTLRWRHGADAHLAVVPALEITVIASSADELERRLPNEVRAALARRAPQLTLQNLVACQRGRRLLLEPMTARVRVRSAKERVQRAEKDQAQQPAVLPRVATDLAAAASEPAFGLDALVEQLAELLTARQPRSVLLVGPSGVGKTALVRELVRCRAAVGLGAATFFSTSGARLVAGMSGYGMWQQRCRQVVQEARKRAAILHLGNLVELMEVGKSEHNPMGIAAYLRTDLARGAVLAVAECTPEELTAIERQAPHVLDVFQRLPVPEPTPAQGRALLAHAAAQRGVSPSVTPAALDVLDRLHRRYAAYSAYPGRPLRFLRNLLHDRREAAAVQPGDVLTAFARETGLPRVLLDPAQPLDLAATRAWFAERVRGQAEAVDLVVDLLATAKAALARPRKPIASLLFIGPTGVGKTELAKALAEFLFGSKQRLTRFDMTEYADPVAVGRLVGGVFGSEGLLTARVREQPFSVVLLDEFEKAHPQFFDVLLQVLGDGRLTDAAGRVADFSNTVVILTSNLGAESFQQGAFGFADSAAADDAGQREAARRHFVRAVQAYLRPEMFNRIDRVVPFAPLGAETIETIAAGCLRRLGERDGLRYRGVTLGWQDGVAAHLGRNGFDARYGARPLLRTIERELLAPLAEQMNRYSTETPLAVDVALAGPRLRIGVKARGDSTGQSAAAAALVDAIQPCVELRRLQQALDRCRAVRDLRNELHRLETEQQRWEKARLRHARLMARLAAAPEAVQRKHAAHAPRGQAGEAARLARIARLREVTDRLARLGQRSCELEEHALETLYARSGEGFDPADLTAALHPLIRELDELLLLFHCRDFDRPEAIVLAVFSEQRDALAQLTWAYRDVARQHKLTIDPVAYLLPRGKPVPAAEPAKPAAPARENEPPKQFWRQDVLIQPKEGREPERAVLVRERVKDLDELLSDPPAWLLGVGLGLAGPAAAPRLLAEEGLHAFTGGGNAPPAQCLVESSEKQLGQYLPPAEIARRGMIGSQDRRRTYDRGMEVIDDVLLGERFAWQPRALRDVLAEAVERLLQRRLVGVLEE